MSKFLHIADIHLETPFRYLGSKGKERRQEIKDAFEGILDKAEEYDVDAVLIAGDLFEHDFSTRDLGNYLCKQFKTLGDTPVLISPGNHDPYVKSSLYSLINWPQNVYVFSQNQFERIGFEDFVVYGIANTNFSDQNNYLKDFEAQEDLPCIGLMHGSYVPYSGLLSDSDVCFPFTEEDLKGLRMDYLALGHYHRYSDVSVDGAVIGSYPGTIEPLNFDEVGTRNAVVVKVSDKVDLEKIPTGIRSYETLELDCSNATCLDDIASWIKKSGTCDKNIVKVVLIGEVDPSVDLKLDELQVTANNRFYFAILEDNTIPYYDIESISQEQSLRGEFVSRILQEMEQNPQKEELLKRALYYGLQAFDSNKKEVPL
ncbi:MAG: DNA repair exonuclease [Archaeoglobaceae archaeon]